MGDVFAEGRPMNMSQIVHAIPVWSVRLYPVVVYNQNRIIRSDHR